jgi:hypothetical protein
VKNWHVILGAIVLSLAAVTAIVILQGERLAYRAILYHNQIGFSEQQIAKLRSLANEASKFEKADKSVPLTTAQRDEICSKAGLAKMPNMITVSSDCVVLSYMSLYPQTIVTILLSKNRNILKREIELLNKTASENGMRNINIFDGEDVSCTLTEL